jgi:hypothetical protein
MINYLHCYRNYRPNVNWNTCGQAAIATITDYWGRNPYNLDRPVRDGIDGLYYWDDGQAVDATKSGVLSSECGSSLLVGFLFCCLLQVNAMHCRIIGN